MASKKLARKVRPELMRSDKYDLAEFPGECMLPKDKQAIEHMSSATVTEDQPAGKGGRVYMSDQEFKEYIKRRVQEVQHMLLALQKASKVDLCSLEMSSATVTEDQPAGKGSQVYMSDQEFKEYIKRRDQEVQHMLLALQKASKIDLCFLIDCTGSMAPFTNYVKETISTWTKEVAAKYPEGDFRCAFVGYTDYDQPEDVRTKLLDFTEDPTEFYEFVDKIQTPGGVGGDTAEDVMGGLKAALTKLTWRAGGTKVLIHIADAPCHGREYHDECINDDYKDGDPAKISHNDMMEKVAKQGIHYYFGHIRKRRTAKMISILNESLRCFSNQKQMITEFNASDPTALKDAVYSSVVSSVSSATYILKGAATPLRHFQVDDTRPDSSKLILLDGMKTPSLSSSTGTFDPQAVGEEVELPMDPMTIKRAPDPFSTGGVRLAFHGFLELSKEWVVLKLFKRTGPKWESPKRFVEVSQLHKITAAYAEEFNHDKPTEAPKLEVLHIDLVQLPDDKESEWYTMERYIEGKYEKFNSNNGYVAASEDSFTAAMQTFSHYSWVKSKKELLICDLQGVRTDRGVILTDPAIHATKFWRYGMTNLGPKGMWRFFKTHHCNDFCKEMRLEKHFRQPDYKPPC